MAKKFYFTTTLSVKGEIISEKLRTRKVDEHRPNGEESSQGPDGQRTATEIYHETRKTSNHRD